MVTILSRPSWYDIEKAVAVLSNQVLKSEKHYDFIVGFGRGGLPPAVIMSHMLDIPLIPVSYSSRSGAGDDKNHDNNLPQICCGTGPTNTSLLLLDDIVDSGLTMSECKQHYHNVGHSVVDTATIYRKQSSVHVPTYQRWSIPRDAPFIVFPWEL